jgi:hypothetical protein
MLLLLSVVATMLIVTIFVLVPHAETGFERTVSFNRPPTCGGDECTAPIRGLAQFVEGDGRYSTVFGSWNASVLGGLVYVGNYVLVTISDGSGAILYSSSGAPDPSGGINGPISGSFDVSGAGPFTFNVTTHQSSPISTTVQGTILTWI